MWLSSPNPPSVRRRKDQCDLYHDAACLRRRRSSTSPRSRRRSTREGLKLQKSEVTGKALQVRGTERFSSSHLNVAGVAEAVLASTDSVSNLWRAGY